MLKKRIDYDRINRIVGPMDCIIRASIGMMIMVCCYTLPVSIVEFLVWHMIACFFWITALTGWDPFYQISVALVKYQRDKLWISGRYK